MRSFAGGCLDILKRIRRGVRQLAFRDGSQWRSGGLGRQMRVEDQHVASVVVKFRSFGGQLRVAVGGLASLMLMTRGGNEPGNGR